MTRLDEALVRLERAVGRLEAACLAGSTAAARSPKAAPTPRQRTETVVDFAVGEGELAAATGETDEREVK
jgi:hypothetical protein